MKKIPLKKRLRYLLDRSMAKGTSGMVKYLLWVVLSTVVIVTALVLIFGLHDEGKTGIAVFWDNLRSGLWSGFPSSSTGEELSLPLQLLKIFLYTLLGLTSLIFSSLLVGIFSTSMRTKVLALQNENPEVIEDSHTVILGFRLGEYALISQMIQAAAGRKRTIVVAENMERQALESAIRSNVKVPKNIRLIAIKAETESAAALKCCSLAQSSTVVINTRDRGRTVKTLLAVDSILKGEKKRVNIAAAVDTDSNVFPAELLREKNAFMLRSGDLAARIAAHAATQPGIFEAFLDMIDFENFEFYFEKRPEAAGVRFGKTVVCAEKGAVVGICRGEDVLLNPPPETLVEKDDLLVVFEKEKDDLKLKDLDGTDLPEPKTLPEPEQINEVAVFGISAAIGTVIRELPDNIKTIRLIGATAQEVAAFVPKNLVSPSEIVPDYRPADSENELFEMLKDTSHIVVLSDRRMGAEEADTQTMVRIMRLRNIKKKHSLSFTITAEMRCENNRKLILENNSEDFVVASDLSSMMLAQITEDTRRMHLFNILLDEKGSEVYLVNAADLGLTGEETTLRELRRRAYAFGYILMGIRTEKDPFIVPDDSAALTLSDSDRLIVIGEGL
ncbi:MAG: hypothetical protein IJV00_10280 [Clostridia bacterium]|nr:hypothetical protein [Clostridia bacterium]